MPLRRNDWKQAQPSILQAAPRLWDAKDLVSPFSAKQFDRGGIAFGSAHTTIRLPRLQAIAQFHQGAPDSCGFFLVHPGHPGPLVSRILAPKPSLSLSQKSRRGEVHFEKLFPDFASLYAHLGLYGNASSRLPSRSRASSLVLGFLCAGLQPTGRLRDGCRRRGGSRQHLLPTAPLQKRPGRQQNSFPATRGLIRIRVRLRERTQYAEGVNLVDLIYLTAICCVKAYGQS